MKKQIIKIEEVNKAERLDVFLMSVLKSESRSYIKTLIEKGYITVNDKMVKSGYSLKTNDHVCICEKEREVIKAEPQNIPINIVYEDEDLAVIDKQQGLVVHPAFGNYDNTLVNAIMYHIKNLSTINGVVRPGIVHRLDKETSGLMVVAKNDFAHKNLANQISKKTCIRKYLALLEGNLKQDDGVINQNLKRSTTDRKKIAVCKPNEGRTAISHFKVLKRFEGYTLTEFKLETGRTHQIRVHANFIKHPIVGDKVYGFKTQKFNLDGQLLHSHYLGFHHPVSKEWLEFNSSLPFYFENIISKLKSTT